MSGASAEATIQFLNSEIYLSHQVGVLAPAHSALTNASDNLIATLAGTQHTRECTIQ